MERKREGEREVVGHERWERFLVCYETIFYNLSGPMLLQQLRREKKLFNSCFGAEMKPKELPNGQLKLLDVTKVCLIVFCHNGSFPASLSLFLSFQYS